MYIVNFKMHIFSLGSLKQNSLARKRYDKTAVGGVEPAYNFCRQRIEKSLNFASPLQKSSEWFIL